MRREFWLGVVVAGLGWSAQAAPDVAWEGRWSGQWQNNGEIDLTIDISGREFSVAVTGAPVSLGTTEFRPSARSGVYDGSTEGGMLDWLSLTREPGPLEGTPLIWARLDDVGGFTLYRFQLDETGQFAIRQLRLTRAAGGALIETIATGPSGPAVVDRADLVRR